MILDEFHLLQPAAAAKLLKTIEEPPASTVFIVLAEQLTPELVTIASRCVRVDFRPLTDRVDRRRTRPAGVDADDAATAAQSANGSLDRARLLSSDPTLSERRAKFASVPDRLDGTGRVVVAAVDELLGSIDAAAEPLKARQAKETAALEERVAAVGRAGFGPQGDRGTTQA